MEKGLPSVQLYSIGPDEADHVKTLLTKEAVMAIKNNEAFGMALVEEGEVRAAACARISPETEELLELLSLYVAPACRRRGLGGTLLMELLEESMAATDGSLKGVVATFLPQTEGMAALLEKAGFRFETENLQASFTFSISDLEESPLLTHRSSIPKGFHIRSLENTSDAVLLQLSESLKRNGIDDLSVAEMKQALQTVSYVLLDENLEPHACAIFTDHGRDRICLAQFYAENGSTAVGLAMLQESAKALLGRFSGETVIEIPTLTESSAGLVKKMVPSSQAVKVIRAELDLIG